MSNLWHPYMLVLEQSLVCLGEAVVYTMGDDDSSLPDSSRRSTLGSYAPVFTHLMRAPEVRRCRLTSASAWVESPLGFQPVESTSLSKFWFEMSTCTLTPR